MALFSHRFAILAALRCCILISCLGWDHATGVGLPLNPSLGEFMKTRDAELDAFASSFCGLAGVESGPDGEDLLHSCYRELLDLGEWTEEALQAEILGPVGVVLPYLDFSDRDRFAEQVKPIFTGRFDEAVFCCLYLRSELALENDLKRDLESVVRATGGLLNGCFCWDAAGLVDGALVRWLALANVTKAREAHREVAQLCSGVERFLGL